MLKAILMDLDDTLYDASAAYRRGEEAAICFGSDVLELSRQEWEEAWLRGKARTKEILKVSAAQHHRLFYIQHALEYLGRSPFEHAEEIYEAYWNAALDGMCLFDGAEEFLRAVKAKELKLGLCTDMTAATQYRKIRRLGIAKYFDAIVTSEEAGVEKPDRKMFELTLAKLEAAHNEAVMIGDNLRKDVEGAKKIGIRAIWKAGSKEVYDGEAFTCYTDGVLQSYCGL